MSQKLQAGYFSAIGNKDFIKVADFIFEDATPLEEIKESVAPIISILEKYHRKALTVILGREAPPTEDIIYSSDYLISHFNRYCNAHNILRRVDYANQITKGIEENNSMTVLQASATMFLKIITKMRNPE